MTLSCECGDWYPEPGEWWHEGHRGTYTPLKELAPARKRRPRCASCGDVIGFDDLALAFPRWRVPDADVEIAIYGEEGQIPIATWYHCERCADLYFSLDELGFCGQPGTDQRDLCQEYGEMQKEAAQNRLAGVNQPSG